MLDFGFYNMDCMEGMKQFPDNYFDIAIVDPPYGDARGGQRTGSENASKGTSIHRLGNAGAWSQMGGWSYQNGRNMGGEIRKKIVAWDIAPPKEYFDELFRVSRNQIIWGGNYFELPATRCFVIWRKTNVPEKFSMAMAEYAWTSFDSNAKVYEYSAAGQKERFHPTQKPVELYKWLVANYMRGGQTVLDTHVGSASSLIAYRETGHKYVGFEIDPDYYRMAKERLDASEAQGNIFDFL